MPTDISPPRLIAPPASLSWCLPADPLRPELQRCIERAYARAHDAHISHYHEMLVGAHAEDGRVLGVIGASLATHGRLFLESYLSAPVELELSRRVGGLVPRDGLVEVGNLAAARPGAAPFLVSALAQNLHASGMRWAVLTATAQVRRLLGELGADLVDLGAADGQALGPRLADWGRYYDRDPRVTAISLPDFVAALDSDPDLRPMHPLWLRARLSLRLRLPRVRVGA